MHQRTTTSLTRPEAPIDTRSLTIVRARLNEQRIFRTGQLDELSSNLVQAMNTSDRNRRQVNRVLRMGAKSALVEIEAALERLADGSYGICERCLEPVPPERLEVLPSVRLCTDCQFLTECVSG